MPNDINIILYADVDILFTSSIKSLEQYEFDENIGVAAVKDLIRHNDYSRLGINENNHTYFNAGIMLLNLKYWRDNNIGQQCLDKLKIYAKKFQMANQDALNVILEGHTDYLHPKFNCLTPFFAKREFLRARIHKEELNRVHEATNSPAIIHYVFVNKPWFKGEFLPYKKEWLDTLAKTEWKNIPIVYRKGMKGRLRIYAKRFLQNAMGILGVEYKPNIFYKKRFRHIQILSLILYYGFAQWLPDSFTPIFGKISNNIRVACVRRLFDYCGPRINIGRRAYFGKGEGIWIGSRSNIGAYSHVPSNIIIGENVMMGPRNYFFENVTHRFADTDRPMIDQGVTRVDGHIKIGDDVWTGREVMVLPGKHIGSHSIVGARSVVTKDIPEGVIVGGNPANIIRTR